MPISTMILLDSDVMIDLLRQYPSAMRWFDTLDEDEEVTLPGYVVMELNVLIGQTDVALGVPLHTFNQKHYFMAVR